MQKLKKERQQRLRPRLIAASTVFALALLALTLIPMSYTQTVGYKVIIPDAGKYCDTAVHQMTLALEAIGYTEAKVSYNETNRSYILSGLPDETDARELAAGIVDVVDCGGPPVVEPDRQIKSGTLYAQMVDKVSSNEPTRLSIQYSDGKFTLNHKDLSGIIDDPKLTDEQKRNKVVDLLDELGVSEAIKYVVISSKDDVEQISFYLAVDSVSGGTPGTLQLSAADGQIYNIFVADSDSALTVGKVKVDRPDSSEFGKTLRFIIELPKKNK